MIKSLLLLIVSFIIISCSKIITTGKTTSCPVNAECQYKYAEYSDLDDQQRKIYGSHRGFMFFRASKEVLLNSDCINYYAIRIKAPETGTSFFIKSKDMQAGAVRCSALIECDKLAIDTFGQTGQPVEGYVKGILTDARSENARWFLNIHLIFRDQKSKEERILDIRQYFYKAYIN
jgi:hypothetical protein